MHVDTCIIRCCSLHALYRMLLNSPSLPDNVGGQHLFIVTKTYRPIMWKIMVRKYGTMALVQLEKHINQGKIGK